MVDGIGRGTTPLTVEHLTGGLRRVRVIKDGFVSQERDVRIGARGAPATLHVTLDAVHIVARRATASSSQPAPVPRGDSSPRGLVLLAATDQQHPVSGRVLAPTMGVEGAAWLDRPEREAEEAPSKAIAALGIAPGSVVADVGAGSGYYTVRLSQVGRARAAASSRRTCNRGCWT